MALAPSEDPRSIVTPDAFQVSRELLGLPLAAPSRRLVAILVDLLLIAVLSQLGGTALAISAAIFFVLLARRGRTSRPTWGGRVLMGCLGLIVLMVSISAVVAVVALVRAEGVRGGRSEGGVEAPGVPGESGSGLLLVQGLGDAILLGQSTTAEEARDPIEGLVTRGRALGMSEGELREVLDQVVPDAPWAEEVIAAALAAPGGGRVEGGADPGTTEAAAGTGPATGETATAADAAAGAVAATPQTDPADQTDPSAPQADPTAGGASPGVAPRWAALLVSGDTMGETREEWLELSRQVLGLSGGDSLATLQGRVDRLEERNEQLDTRMGSLRNELEAEREQEEGFFLPFFRGIFEDLGLAFGFGTIYLTIFTAWWQGQTPGKRLLGVRVLRLDGKPMGWWDAFERAGGYAAGFATGLLGFAQVFWDPNRQAIHDRVSSTVVVREGAPRTPGQWASAVDSDPGRGVRYEFERREES